MKIFLALLGILIIVVLLFYPYVIKEKKCYDSAQASYNDINFNIASRGWSQQDVCAKRVDVINDLDDCIKNATASGSFAVTYGDLFIQRAVFLVRPFTKGIATLKSEHNDECVNFYKYQF